MCDGHTPNSFKMSWYTLGNFVHFGNLNRILVLVHVFNSFKLILPKLDKPGNIFIISSCLTQQPRHVERPPYAKSKNKI